MNKQINLSLNKGKKRSWKFWFVFWLVSFFLLLSWGIFWRYHNKGVVGFLGIAKPFIKTLPLDRRSEEELFTALDVFNKITKSDKEQTFLILFQNNLEIRPGGGFIGAFGIMKIQGQKITHIDVHDTGVFDSGMKTNVTPPYPMEQMLNINDWEMRDANWYADFPTSAEKVEYFYHLEGGMENIDGIFAVSTDLLPSFLAVTGPIVLDGYLGEYNSENAITKLEYQVEKGYRDQGIEKGMRKYVMKDLASEILKKVSELSWVEKKEFLQVIEKHLDEKDIMIYFKDAELQKKISGLGWSGEIKNTNSDYLMMVDANLGALKTDLYMQRNFEYTVDLSGEKPRAKLDITYKNTAQARDWMTSDYLTYLRVYVPEGSWFTEDKNGMERVFGKEFSRRYVGVILKVPIDQEKKFIFEYELPEEIVEDYSLIIQKQSGINNTEGKVIIIKKDRSIKEHEIDLRQDVMFKE